MVVDCFTFNGEFDLLEIRLNVLNDYVDEFIIVEAPTTFSGKPKPLYYEQNKERYAKWHDKIKYFVINEAYTPEEIALAKSSPNTKGAEHWKHEFLQKESIKKALTHLSDNDIVFIGDVDEIWDPSKMDSYGIPQVYKLKMNVYTYYLNNSSSEEFWGPVISTWGRIKKSCLNHIRTNPEIKTSGCVGWHFTSMGGYEEVKRKLEDSYTAESYADKVVMDNLEHNVINSRDFLFRPFNYIIDESEWPQYLKDNRNTYRHLLK